MSQEDFEVLVDGKVDGQHVQADEHVVLRI